MSATNDSMRAVQQVPYDQYGNLMHAAYRCVDWDHPISVPGCLHAQHRWLEPSLTDPVTYTGVLTYEGFVRGRSGQSAAYFRVKDSAGHMYPMFSVDMDEVLRTIGVAGGQIPTATWEPYKHGQNYGLRMVKGKR